MPNRNQLQKVGTGFFAFLFLVFSFLNNLNIHANYHSDNSHDHRHSFTCIAFGLFANPVEGSHKSSEPDHQQSSDSLLLVSQQIIAVPAFHLISVIAPLVTSIASPEVTEIFSFPEGAYHLPARAPPTAA